TMTVLDSRLVAEHSRMKHSVISDALALPASHRADRGGRERALGVLRTLQIEGYAERVVQNLPFGVQKLVEMGRALVSEPKLMLLDEPAAGSNPHDTQRLAGLIQRVRDTL